MYLLKFEVPEMLMHHETVKSSIFFSKWKLYLKVLKKTHYLKLTNLFQIIEGMYCSAET